MARLMNGVEDKTGTIIHGIWSILHIPSFQPGSAPFHLKGREKLRC